MASSNQNLGLSHLCAYFLVPPLGVYWRFGCGCHLFICTVLTILFWFPGVIYAVFVLSIEDMNMGIAFLLALFVPPVGVFWRFGCGFDVLICTVLTLCFHVPGAVYAFAVLALKNPDVDDDDRPIVYARSHGSQHSNQGHNNRMFLSCEDPEANMPLKQAGGRV